MHIRTTVAMLLPMLLTACSAATPTHTVAPETATRDASTPAFVGGPPPGAAGKISPDMVGNVSPVPAFMGLGEGFSIEIRSEGERTANGMRHRVHLVWGTHEAEGTLFYRSASDPNMPGAARTPIALDGILDTAQGRKTIRVDIVAETCAHALEAYPQRVTVSVQGETAMRGCGELAVY